MKKSAAALERLAVTIDYDKGEYGVTSSRPGVGTHLIDIKAQTCSCAGFQHRGSCPHLPMAQARYEQDRKSVWMPPRWACDALAAEAEAGYDLSGAVAVPVDRAKGLREAFGDE